MLSKGTLEDVFSEWQLLQLILTVDLAGNSLHVPLSSTHLRRESALWPTGHTQVLATAMPTALHALQSVPLAVKDFTPKIFHLGLPFVLSQLETTGKALQECKFRAMLCCLPTAGSCEFLLLCALAIRAHSPRCRENRSQPEQVVVSVRRVSSLCVIWKNCAPLRLRVSSEQLQLLLQMPIRVAIIWLACVFFIRDSCALVASCTCSRSPGQTLGEVSVKAARTCYQCKKKNSL